MVLKRKYIRNEDNDKDNDILMQIIEKLFKAQFLDVCFLDFGFQLTLEFFS